MTYHQLIFEIECYMTGSLVAVATFQIRSAYAQVIACYNSDEAVADIIKILPKEFDERYQPTGGGKVKHFRDNETDRVSV